MNLHKNKMIYLWEAPKEQIKDQIRYNLWLYLWEIFTEDRIDHIRNVLSSEGLLGKG